MPGGSWYLQSQTDAQGDPRNDTLTYNQARDVFQNTLRDVQNPSDQAKYYENLFRDYTIPMFDEQKRLNQGNLQSTLGNQYQSTFGQLIADEQARKDAIARSGLELDAFNAGQDQIDRLFGRAGQAGGFTDIAQQIRLRPYELLGGLTTGLGNMNANQNQSLAAIAGANRQSGGGAGGLAQGLMSLASLIPGPQQPAVAGANMLGSLVRRGVAPSAGNSIGTIAGALGGR